ncbi:TetR family transcriptional regulator [Actinoplanes sp. ATCC 53533]|uniref:TetR/AcrR family transcriptional regulator n=1 Tax=Actinoplanes sp. ATCC 53533 TaxID=1288362 RepID=UPI000F7AA8F2|nr:TetR/AcrR family transcriptional regulator [Actinoplanes sp. ATCC 53533]RSM44307.1 TetR family transcriptional regulator [Actinoplanes sp. ATCC 53533]
MVRTKTRDEIIAVAAELFSRAGFKGTSLQDIAAGVGCSKATLLYHFTTKEAILAALIAPAAAELADLDARLATLEGMAVREAAIDGFVDLVLRYRREAGIIYYGSQDVLCSPPFAELKPLIDNLCAAFAAGATDPADQIAAEVLLAGISSVAIGKPDDAVLRSALAAVAKRALLTPPMKD